MTEVSVIIPAFNEAGFIKQTVVSIQKNQAYEIIVVDNGSTDATREIAQGLGTKVLEKPEGTIAAVRNAGAMAAKGEILVFIDADVSVSDEWHLNMRLVIESLTQHELTVTGSRCLAPGSDSFINKYWYARLADYNANYINSGHLITTRVLFKRVGGFSEHLETAEDYDFCQKARLIGAEIRNNRSLSVTHEGYPDSLWGFVRRERWHGSQDVSNWASFIESKIAWFAALNLVLFLTTVVAVLVGNLEVIPVYLVTLYLVSLVLSVYKFGIGKVDHLFLTPILFYLYLCGRSLAIVDRLLKAFV